MKTSKITPRRRLASALLLAAFTPFGFAQTWDGGGADTNWSTAENWVDNVLPDFGANPAITLTGTSNYASHADEAVTLTSLVFNPGGGNASLTGEMLTFLGAAKNSDALINVGNATLSGNVTIQNNIKLLGAGSIRATTRNLTLNGNLELSAGEVQFNANASRSITLNGAISGNLNHVRFTGHANGTGSIYINVANTYQATNTIWKSKVIVSVDALTTGGAFGAGTSSIYMGANANEDFMPSLLTDGAVTVARNIEIITNPNSGKTNKTTLGGTTADVSVFSGAIQLGSNNQAGEDLTLTAASGGRVNFTDNLRRATDATGVSDTVTKIGGGIVALSGGDNTYLGATTVEEGVLLVNGVLSGGGEAVTVYAGATLGGAGGNIGRDVILQSGAFLEVGDNHGGITGLLTVDGDLDLADGVTVKFDLGADAFSSDRIYITGALTLGDVTFDVTTLSGFGSSFSYTLLTADGGITGGLSDITLTGSPLPGYSLQLDGNSILLVSSVIPEPSAAALLISLGALAGVVLRRPARR